MTLSRSQLQKQINRLSQRHQAPLPRMPDALELAQRAGIEPDAWQADVLRSESTRLLLNCSRQSGKSTVTGLLAVSTALTQPGSLILLISPTLRQSGELFRSCARVYNSGGGPALVPPVSETALSLTLRNGSRIVSLPGTEAHVRGFAAPALVAVDEASRVDDEMFAAILPMFATNDGRLVLLSTPWGRRGFFWESWNSAGWQKVKIRADQCTRISPEHLEEQRARLGNFWFGQEYECVFLDPTGSAFAEADIARAFEGNVSLWSL